MSRESQTIEAEVLEIDGAAPEPPRQVEREAPRPGPGQSWQDWQKWSGRVRQLDARWWPLWVVLGIIALVLFLTLGLALAVILVIAKLVRNLILGFTALFAPQTTTLR